MINGLTFLAASTAVCFAMANSAAAGTSDCKVVRIAEWPVRLQRNQLITDGAINGRKIGVLLATGSAINLIPRSAAVRLGLTRWDAPGHRVFGVGGETYAEYANVDELTIGEAVRKNWRVLVAGEQDFGPDIAFVLGYDFFAQVDVEFDLAHNAVRLLHAKDCDGVSLAYWAPGGAGEVKIEATAADNRIVLPVQINGQPARAMLDSGATASLMSKHLAASLGVTPETPDVFSSGSIRGFGGKRVDSWTGPFQSFAVGDEIIRNTRIRFADLNVTRTETGSRLRGISALQERLKVTVSIGVADRQSLDVKPAAAIKAADEALYRAKKAGRNRVSR